MLRHWRDSQPLTPARLLDGLDYWWLKSSLIGSEPWLEMDWYVMVGMAWTDWWHIHLGYIPQQGVRRVLAKDLRRLR